LGGSLCGAGALERQTSSGNTNRSLITYSDHHLHLLALDRGPFIGIRDRNMPGDHTGGGPGNTRCHSDGSAISSSNNSMLWGYRDESSCVCIFCDRPIKWGITRICYVDVCGDG